MMAASPRLLASICATISTLAVEVETMGAFGRSFDTGNSFFCLLLDDLTEPGTLP